MSMKPESGDKPGVEGETKPEKAEARESLPDLWRDLFGRFFTDWPSLFRRPEMWHMPEAWREWFGGEMMPVEEYMDGDTLVVRAELAGIDPEKDVDLEVVDGMLRIRAERRKEERIEERDYRRRELRYGAFARMIPLPTGVSENDIRASYRDGILEVRVPIPKEKAASTKVQVRRG